MQHKRKTYWSKLLHFVIAHKIPITIISVLLTVTAGISLIILPYCGLIKFAIPYKIFKVGKSLFSTSGIFTLIVSLLLQIKIDKRIRVRISAVLAPILIVLITNAVLALTGFAILEDKYIEESKKESNDSFEFIIDFDDLLFTSYSTSDLRNHKDALKKHIMSAVKTANENNINANDSGYSDYEEYTRKADNYEEAYMLLRKKGLFDNDDYYERTRLNVISTDYREKADKNHKDSSNQSTLLSDYDDGADECYIKNNYNESLNKFLKGLRWGLIGAGTAYEESNGEHSAKSKQIVDKMIKIYKKLSEYDEFSTDTRNRAEILVEVMKSIKNEL